MKKSLFIFLSFISAGLSFAQLNDPVKWSFSSKKINTTTYEVHLTAILEDNWHIYSQTTPDGGPVATIVTFTKNPLLIISGIPKEIGKLEKRHEKLFGVDVMQYSDKVEFVQIVKMKGKVKTVVSGSIEFMVCNEEMCLPPARENFSIAFK